MLKVAPDASTIERKLEELYPGEIKVVEWDRCPVCGKDVDAYIYIQGERFGYCYAHYYDSNP